MVKSARNYGQRFTVAWYGPRSMAGGHFAVAFADSFDGPERIHHVAPLSFTRVIFLRRVSPNTNICCDDFVAQALS